MLEHVGRSVRLSIIQSNEVVVFSTNLREIPPSSTVPVTLAESSTTSIKLTKVTSSLQRSTSTSKPIEESSFQSSSNALSPISTDTSTSSTPTAPALVSPMTYSTGALTTPTTSSGTMQSNNSSTTVITQSVTAVQPTTSPTAEVKPQSPSTRYIGVGVGIGVGVCCLIAATAVWFWSRRYRVQARYQIRSCRIAGRMHKGSAMPIYGMGAKAELGSGDGRDHRHELPADETKIVDKIYK